MDFNPMVKGYVVLWQSGQENTKESILPVCDIPTLTKVQYKKGRRFAELCIGIGNRLIEPH